MHLIVEMKKQATKILIKLFNIWLNVVIRSNLILIVRTSITTPVPRTSHHSHGQIIK